MAGATKTAGLSDRDSVSDTAGDADSINASCTSGAANAASAINTHGSAGAAGSAGADFSLVRIILHTGRPHQIRAQFAHIGHPVAGDRKYGDNKANINRKPGGYKMRHIPSPALWAASFEFLHPVKQSPIAVSAPAPRGEYPWDCFKESDFI